MTSAPERPPEISPLVDWFSRHGMKALGALLLVELGFHAFAVTSAKKRDAAATAATPAAAATVTPASAVSDSLADSTAAATADSAGTR